jgi:hypothetical protein
MTPKQTLAVLDKQLSSLCAKVERLEAGIRAARALADHVVHGENGVTAGDIHDKLTKTLQRET